MKKNALVVLLLMIGCLSFADIVSISMDYRYDNVHFPSQEANISSLGVDFIFHLNFYYNLGITIGGSFGFRLNDDASWWSAKTPCMDALVGLGLEFYLSETINLHLRAASMG